MESRGSRWRGLSLGLGVGCALSPSAPALPVSIPLGRWVPKALHWRLFASCSRFKSTNVNYISIKLDKTKNAKLGWGKKEGNFRENSDMGDCGEHLLLVRRYFKCITWIVSAN